MFYLTKPSFVLSVLAGLSIIAVLSACAIPAPPPRALSQPTSSLVAVTTPVVENPTATPMVTPVVEPVAETSPGIANLFDVSVSQMFLDTAGFHGIAETLSDTRKIDTSYLSTVNRVTKVLTQTVWPAELNDEAQAFIGTLGTFAAALTEGDVEAAVTVSDEVHDAQHDISHHIDTWTASNPTPSETVNSFDVSVAQMFLDTAGFHGMLETLSDTRKIDTGYLSTVNRVTKVLTHTVWPAELNAEAKAFIGTLGTFAAALTAGDVEAAVTASDEVHDAQHELSHHIDAWLASGPVRAKDAHPFEISVAQMFLDTAGFHGMAETLSDTHKIDTSYLSTVNRVTKVLTHTVWPAELNDEAQAFIGTLGTFVAALTEGDVEAAVTASDEVHDAQHELSHHIDAWLAARVIKA